MFVDYWYKVLDCKRCSLYKGGEHCCPGIGTFNIKIMFVGEALGRVKNSSLRNLVFVGNKLSDLMLDIIYSLWPNGYDDVYLTNIVKCNPPNNRTPTKEEINTCSRWLREEIKLIKPKVIIALGKVAANWFGVREPLNRARNKEYKWESSRLFVVYHPAYILRYGGKAIEQYKGEFKLIKKVEDSYE